MSKRLISVVSGCFNEVENIPIFYERTRKVLAKFPDCDYEFVIADNASTDGTRDVLRKIAAEDPNFRVILNAGNFGHIRSPYNALLQSRGDVVFYLCSDLQEPPELLEEMMKKHDEGFPVVCGVKPRSKENLLIFKLRCFYYWLLERFSDTPQVRNFTGFGLYDRKVIDALRKFNDPYPYFRGLVSEIGFARAEVPFTQEQRKFGRTKNNFFTLYDMAMTGFVNHTKLPLRLAVFCGFIVGAAGFLLSLFYLVAKLIWWDAFSLGMAPLMISMFFFASVQLVFIGIIGEYLGAIWTQVKNKPLVIEEERLNFPPGESR